MPKQRELTEGFRALHAPGPGFIMPNAWDVGSAIVLAEAGFTAIATTSAGIAFSLGKPDGDARNAVREWLRTAAVLLSPGGRGP